MEVLFDWLTVLTMIAVMMAAITKPRVGVGVGLGCLVAGILAFVVGARMAQNSGLAFGDPGTGGIIASLLISFGLVVAGVVVLCGALVGFLIERNRRPSSSPRPSSAPSAHREARARRELERSRCHAHGRGVHRARARSAHRRQGWSGSRAGGSSR